MICVPPDLLDEASSSDMKCSLAGCVLFELFRPSKMLFLFESAIDVAGPGCFIYLTVLDVVENLCVDKGFLLSLTLCDVLVSAKSPWFKP